MPNIKKLDIAWGRPRVTKPVRQPRIGIYGGSFDPVHAGHIAFALQALKAAKLDQVIFVPERRPRGKPGVEHYAHRVAMLTAAIQPHNRLAVLEVVDNQLSVRRTLPQLQTLFPHGQFILLMGADAALAVSQWQHAKRLLGQTELLVGVRSARQELELEQAIAGWQQAPQSLTMVRSYAPEVSSHRIRQALRAGQPADGLLASVQRYARAQWLYVSPSVSISRAV